MKLNCTLRFNYEGEKIAKRTKVRCGHLWAIRNDKSLSYANLNSKKPKFYPVSFQNGEKVMFLWVSTTGKYCCVRTTISHYIICCDGLIPQKVFDPSPDTFKCVAFTEDKNGEEFVFFGTEKGVIFFESVKNVGTSNNKINPSKNPIGEIVGIYVCPLSNDKFALILIANNNSQSKTFYPFMLKSTFEADFVDINPRAQNLAFVNGSESVTFDNYSITAISMNDHAFLCTINKEAVKPDEIFGLFEYIDIPKDSNYVIYSEDLLFLFEKGKSTVTVRKVIEKSADPEFLLDIPFVKAPLMDYDPYEKAFYVFGDANDPNALSVTRYTFSSPYEDGARTGIIGFNIFQYNRFIAEKKEKLAIASLIKAGLSINQSLEVAKGNLKVQLQIFTHAIKNMPDSKKRLKRALATHACEIFVRIGTESEKKQSDQKLLKQFSEWIKEMLARGLLSEGTVIKTLDMYGWNEPYEKIFTDKAALDHDFAFGKVDDAVNRLKEIKDDATFVNAAIRLYHSCPEKVIDAIYARSSVSFPEFSAIIKSPHSSPHIMELLNNRMIDNKWLRAAFVTQLSKEGKELLDTKNQKQKLLEESKDAEEKESIQRTINRLDENYQTLVGYASKFFTSTNPEPCDEEAAFREWAFTGQTAFVAAGLNVKGRYSDAARADPKNAIKIIAETKDPVDRKRVAISVLRSMEPQKAGELAQSLLTDFGGAGIETTTLVGFLPDDVVICDLENAIDKYIENNTKTSQEQKRKFNSAMLGIDRAHKLLHERKDPIISLSSMETCAKCGKLLLTDHGIVFPCKHGFHIDCIKESLRAMGIENMEVTSNCPVCSFLSASMITVPFEPKIDVANKWSTDRDLLTKELEMDNKKRFNFVPHK